ncbi:MAG TPA: hypothetical protein VM942_04215 [Acidimicrobiales bacterium]|nr:hypothetical protein [Acidimicrobiales bacterium]
MQEQLLLLPSDDRPWRLDERTREVGRQGIEQARAALRQAAGDDTAPPTRRQPGRQPRRQPARQPGRQPGRRMRTAA